MSTYQSPIVFAVFRSDSDAKRAIDALRNAGFGHDQIGLAWHERGAPNINYRNDFVNLGVPDEQAEYYYNEFRAGHPVVSVRTDGRDQDAYSILHNYNSYDYASRDAQTADYAQASPAADTDVYAEQYGNEERRSLPLRAERLVADKQTVQAGEARLHKDVVAEQQSVDVPVNREEVVVERRPGSGQGSDTPIGQDETIRILVHEEQVNVSKNTVETGEVSIGKRTVQDQKRVSDTVRREEAHLETDGNPTVRTNDNPDNV